MPTVQLGVYITTFIFSNFHIIELPIFPHMASTTLNSPFPFLANWIPRHVGPRAPLALAEEQGLLSPFGLLNPNMSPAVPGAATRSVIKDYKCVLLV